MWNIVVSSVQASGLKFSESEIDAYREAFMFFDRDKDEKIDAAELANVMRTLGGCLHPPRSFSLWV